jgi:hypothetical protein
LLQKERKERMALIPDEDFEGDFLEVQKNTHGNYQRCKLQVLFSTDSIPGAIRK